jgi:aquaporin Z
VELSPPTEHPSASEIDRERATGGHLARDAWWVERFADGELEWRRLFAEVLGTFLLLLAGAGAAVVAAATNVDIGRAASVSAPGLTVLAVILAMGAVSGAHLNPVVSIAFALRGDFPWRRVPGYVLAQVIGGTLAILFLLAMFGRAGSLGATVPGAGINNTQALFMELLLTAGLVSTILGTASRAQNLGPISAFGVAAYIILAGLWSSPVSGASMNPVRSFAPDLILGDFSHFWVYLLGPLAGAILAVLFAHILRGPGGRDPLASKAAEGTASPGQH